jgi:hypothetical protein
MQQVDGEPMPAARIDARPPGVLRLIHGDQDVLAIRKGRGVHKIGVVPNRLQDPGVLARAAAAFQRNAADAGDEFFVEDQFDDAHLPAVQVDGPFDPISKYIPIFLRSKIFTRLGLDETSSFLDGHKLFTL